VGTPNNSRPGPPSGSPFDPDVRGVLTYSRKPNETIAVPQSESWNVTNPDCADIDYSLLKPHPSSFLQPYSPSLEQPSLTLFLNYTFPIVNGPNVRTLVNDRVYQVNDTAYPTLYAIQENATWTPPASEQRNLMVIPDEYRDKTVRIVLQGLNTPGSHPFHMHGHGFLVVASGVGSFDDAALTYTNSVDLHDVIVRDTLVVPSDGWAAVQYVFPVVPYNMQPVLTRRLLFVGLPPIIQAFGVCIVTLVSCLKALSTPDYPPVISFTATSYSRICVDIWDETFPSIKTVRFPVIRLSILGSTAFLFSCHVDILYCAWTVTNHRKS